jgi:hypothetical protein
MTIAERPVGKYTAEGSSATTRQRLDGDLEAIARAFLEAGEQRGALEHDPQRAGREGLARVVLGDEVHAALLDEAPV